MDEVTIIGVDLAKNVFQVHGAAADGWVVFRKKLSRPQFARFMTEQPPCLVATDADVSVGEPVGFQSLSHQLTCRTTVASNKINELRTREASTSDPPLPPLAHREPEARSLTGPFFFLFQRGLAKPSDLRRLEFWPKSVSEASASLSTRPSSKSRRIQKVTHFQHVAEIGLRRI